MNSANVVSGAVFTALMLTGSVVRADDGTVCIEEPSPAAVACGTWSQQGSCANAFHPTWGGNGMCYADVTVAGGICYSDGSVDLQTTTPGTAGGVFNHPLSSICYQPYYNDVCGEMQATGQLDVASSGCCAGVDVQGWLDGNMDYGSCLDEESETDD